MTPLQAELDALAEYWGENLRLEHDDGTGRWSVASSPHFDDDWTVIAVGSSPGCAVESARSVIEVLS